MDTMIRNLNERLYREMKARAALEGKTMGQVVGEAMEVYLSRSIPTKRGTIAELQPEPYPDGNEDLSRRVDDVLYGR